MAFRDGPFENIKVPLVWTAAVTVVVAAIGCVLLLISDARAQTSPYQPVRSGVEAVAGPVGFDVGSDASAEAIVRECATDAEHVYLPATGAALKTAFRAIGEDISRLRISK